MPDPVTVRSAMPMTRYGYFLSSEENSPPGLVRQARLADEPGFDGS
jgi:hypothetical protein